MVFTALIFSRPPRAWIFLATSSSAVWAEASAVRQRIPSAIFRTTRMQFAPLLTQRILSKAGMPIRRAAWCFVSYGMRSAGSRFGAGTAVHCNANWLAVDLQLGGNSTDYTRG